MNPVRDKETSSGLRNGLCQQQRLDHIGAAEGQPGAQLACDIGMDNVGVGDEGSPVDGGQPGMLPCLAAIGRAVNAVTLHDIGAQLAFAHADIDNVGIAGRHRHRPHR